MLQEAIGKHWIFCLRSFFFFSFAQEMFLQDAPQLLHGCRIVEEFSACMKTYKLNFELLQLISFTKLPKKWTAALQQVIWNGCWL